MIAGFPWPDIVIGAVLALSTYKGFARGFISEVGGLVAIVAGFVAPHFYNGSADAPIDHLLKCGLATAHLVGMILSGLLAYVVVLIVAAVLNRVAKLPILGIGNKLAGAVVGLAKGAVLIWVVIFVTLFFPLTPEIRDALHHSQLAPYFTTFDPLVDSAIELSVPTWVKPWLIPYFLRHHL